MGWLGVSRCGTQPCISSSTPGKFARNSGPKATSPASFNEIPCEVPSSEPPRKSMVCGPVLYR